MHELSLCRAIATTATDNAGGRTVLSVSLRIGHFRQVVPETLAFCWDLHVRDTDLEGCRLEVDYVPATVRCAACDRETTLDHPILLCGHCGGRDVELVSGEEFLIEAIEVAEEVQ